MRIIRYESPIGPQTGIVTADDQVVKAVGSIAEGYTPGEVIAPLADVDLLAPLAPGKIVAIGKNYLEHVNELDKTATVPEFPIMFMKPPSGVIGPNAPIRLANPENETHYEAELCVVIGKTATDVDEVSALDYVFGYTCGNDVSDRKVQFASGQWIQGKGYDTYCPLGPWIETELDPMDALVQSRLNGETRQSDSTSILIFNVPFLISYISKVMTLYPGDVIMTGTPHGVGPMKSGDTIEVDIAGIGVLSNPVVNR